MTLDFTYLGPASLLRKYAQLESLTPPAGSSWSELSSLILDVLHPSPLLSLQSLMHTSAVVTAPDLAHVSFSSITQRHSCLDPCSAVTRITCSSNPLLVPGEICLGSLPFLRSLAYLEIVLTIANLLHLGIPMALQGRMRLVVPSLVCGTLHVDPTPLAMSWLHLDIFLLVQTMACPDLPLLALKAVNLNVLLPVKRSTCLGVTLSLAGTARIDSSPTVPGLLHSSISFLLQNVSQSSLLVFAINFAHSRMSSFLQVVAHLKIMPLAFGAVCLESVLSVLDLCHVSSVPSVRSFVCLVLLLAVLDDLTAGALLSLRGIPCIGLFSLIPGSANVDAFLSTHHLA